MERIHEEILFLILLVLVLVSRDITVAVVINVLFCKFKLVTYVLFAIALASFFTSKLYSSHNSTQDKVGSFFSIRSQIFIKD